MMQALPIGIQDFRKIRENNYLYVDKTKHIHQLIKSGSYYFLSRPRRFGKSLTLSTLKELFSGNKNLFKDLWIENHWDWTQQYPVIHIHFDSMGYKEKGLQQAIIDFLSQEAQSQELELQEKYPGGMFKELIEKMHRKYGKQVVILIDEYDKPIIDYLDHMEQAKANQQTLKTFYSIIKSSDRHIRFLLITGVSKFSKVSIFSELNNLDDLTIDWRSATLTGYTQEELEHYFKDRLSESLKIMQTDLQTQLNNIRQWYNSLFKSIPPQIFIKDKEACYHSVIFLVFQYLGQFIEAEVHTSDGRIDAIVQTATHIYLLEFKPDKSAQAALNQIEQRAYAEKFKSSDKIITGIGINFSSERKAIEDWKIKVL